MRDRGYAEDLMAPRPGGRLAGARADDRPGGRRGPPPRRPQRPGQGLRAGPAAPRRSTSPATPGWIRDVALGGKPLTFGNLEKAVPGRALAERLPRVGRRAVRPVGHLGGHRLGARALERAPRREGGARRRGRPPRGRGRRGRHRRLQPRRAPARLGALDRPRPAGGRRRGRRSRRGARRRGHPHRPGRGQDARPRRPGRADRARLGRGRWRLAAKPACATCSG